MAGPSCEVQIPVDDSVDLQRIDDALASFVDQLDRTRKGRVWNVRVHEHPYSISFDAETNLIELSAAVNDGVDYAVLRQLAALLADVVGGQASEPMK